MSGLFHKHGGETLIYMYMHVQYVHTYIHEHACTVRTHVYTCTCMYSTYTCIYMYMHVQYVHTYIHIHACTVRIHVHACTVRTHVVAMFEILLSFPIFHTVPYYSVVLDYLRMFGIHVHVTEVHLSSLSSCSRVSLQNSASYVNLAEWLWVMIFAGKGSQTTPNETKKNCLPRVGFEPMALVF